VQQAPRRGTETAEPGRNAPMGLPPDAQGVLASQHLQQAVAEGIIDAGAYKILPASIQPASVDLRLGEVAYRIRCSFLPQDSAVDVKLKDFVIDEIDLRSRAVLETNRPYLIPLLEELSLPPNIRGRANPKSSTGRLDVFTRVISDNSHRFDEIAPGYHGNLYLEVVPLSFTIAVKQGLALNQLRLATGTSTLTDDEIRDLHAYDPVLTRGDRAIPPHALTTGGGLFLGLDLRGDEHRRVGYSAKKYAPVLEADRVGAFDPEAFWEPVFSEPGDRIVLAPERFYLLLSDEAVRIPPEYAAEMTAYDPTSGELRTHYAGFFDPGFGYDPDGRFFGSRAALEVRAHDVPFMIEHGQKVCKLTFERMIERPDFLYGEFIGSSYQRQADTLSKHFKRPESATAVSEDASPPQGPNLFDQEDGTADRGW
jgi:dCTP deaminase